MATDTVKCPECGFSVPIGEALTKEIEASIRADAKKELVKQEKIFESRIKLIEEAADKNLEDVKTKLENKIREEVKSTTAIEMNDLQESLNAKIKALDKANEREVNFRKEKRELEERERNLKLDVQIQLDKGRIEIAEKAAKEAEEAHSLKDREKDTKLSQMLLQIEDLKRKAEQSSQKMQGEILETQLEETLRTTFPFDELNEVSSGVKGGDIIQTVKTKSGIECGKILWELKRTRSFSEAWLSKLKADGRACKADICLLVSEALPDGITNFAERQGVWISGIEACIPLAHVLRMTLMRVAGERSIQSGKKDKAGLVYEYLTGTEFKGRIEAIVEAFRSMKNDLDSEKRATEKMFAKREKQLQQVVLNIAGMHGDLEGIAGSALPTIKILELPQK